MTSGWTTPADIVARVRRRWDDGSLLRAYADDEPFEPIEIPLRGPAPSQVGDDLSAARDWIAALGTGRRDGQRYELLWREIGGRQIGRNRLPTHAVLTDYQQAWALLGTRSEVRVFGDLLASARDRPAVRAWLLAHPNRALGLAAEMPRLIAAYDWLDGHRDFGCYLREISAPGVDTKFAEGHRPVLAAMLGVSSTASGFLADLGLRTKPTLIRFRPAPGLGLPSMLSELAARPAELAALDLRPATVLIVENEISYLAVDVPDDGVVFWGKGFDVDAVGRLPWLAGVDVIYWGDIDTHGYAILDRLRAWLPQARSVLMDRETLLAHRDRWGIEDRPATAALTRLSVAEHGLYCDLVGDLLGEGVRLEQERIDWGWARPRLDP